MLDASPIQAQPTDTMVQPGRRTSVSRPLIYLTLAVLAMLFVFPYLWMVSASLKPLRSVFSTNLIPNPVSWSNYPDVFEQTEFLRWSVNSALVVLLAVAGVAFSSALIAYPFAKLDFPLKRVFFALILSTMLLPGEVTMVPVFLVWRELGLVNTLFPLWVPNLFGSAFYIFLLRQFYLTIPNDLKEAALLDGASHFRIFKDIMLPLVKPAMVTVVIFEFVAKWNDYITPLIYLNDPNKYTLAIGVASFLKEPGLESRWDLWMAGSVMMTIPTVLLFALAQRQFIEGIAAGAVKG
jgi:ABC-type glycerol-3-phosphate transport system permease component